MDWQIEKAVPEHMLRINPIENNPTQMVTSKPLQKCIYQSSWKKHLHISGRLNHIIPIHLRGVQETEKFELNCSEVTGAATQWQLLQQPNKKVPQLVVAMVTRETHFDLHFCEVTLWVEMM